MTDRGSYVCQLTNEVGQAEQQFQVDVFGKKNFRIDKERRGVIH